MWMLSQRLCRTDVPDDPTVDGKLLRSGASNDITQMINGLLSTPNTSACVQVHFCCVLEFASAGTRHDATSQMLIAACMVARCYKLSNYNDHDSIAAAVSVTSDSSRSCGSCTETRCFLIAACPAGATGSV